MLECRFSRRVPPRIRVRLHEDVTKQIEKGEGVLRLDGKQQQVPRDSFGGIKGNNDVCCSSLNPSMSPRLLVSAGAIPICPLHDMSFLIPKLDRLPTRILPCPIIEAVLEVRFTTEEPWALLPGLLSTLIRDKYDRTINLPLAEFPEPLRREDPRLVYQPLIQFVGNPFTIQLGPRVFSLVSNQEYPGWTAVFDEMAWLLDVVRKANFVREGERLGLRYIDFFQIDLFQRLMLQVNSDGQRVEGSEMSLTTAFARDDFSCRLSVANNALVRSGDRAAKGSVFDLDIGLTAAHFDLFENGLDCFQRAHQANKEVFFGLLRPDFLASLNPEYA